MEEFICVNCRQPLKPPLVKQGVWKCFSYLCLPWLQKGDMCETCYDVFYPNEKYQRRRFDMEFWRKYNDTFEPP